ncbi:MAG: glycosyltransferase [Planctomycetota bacterium]
MRPLRVGVQAWLCDGTPSGARTRLLGLLEGLRAVDADLELRLLCGPVPDPALVALCRGERRFALVPTAIPAGGTLARARREARLLPALVDEHGLDLHDHAALPLPRLAIPVCLTLHDLRDLGGFGRGFRSRLVHQELERAVARAARVVVPSPQVRAELHARWPRARVDVVPAGLPAPAAPPARARRCFVVVGRPEPRKRLDLALEAWSRARALRIDLPPLVIAAPVDAEAALRRTFAEARRRSAAPGRADGAGAHLDDVELRLGLDDRGRDALLADAVALLFPSALEGFGMPALEALRLGVPVLAPEGSAQAWVAGAGGRPLPADRPEAWARALVRHEDLAALEPAALARARELDAVHAARAWLGSWERALGQEAGR